MFHGLTGIVATPSFINCDTKKNVYVYVDKLFWQGTILIGNRS